MLELQKHNVKPQEIGQQSRNLAVSYYCLLNEFALVKPPTSTRLVPYDDSSELRFTSPIQIINDRFAPGSPAIQSHTLVLSSYEEFSSFQRRR
jgi:hypothetical protein